jgi:dihydroorotate dehydrogenase (NAD+) catalytic subunit
MEKINLEVKIKGTVLKTPLMTASGTSGTSTEIQKLKLKDKILESLGAFVTKGVTLNARPGNPEIRVVETRTGLLNSIGLQNSGANVFIEKELPNLLNYNLPIIVNISASSVEEFGRLANFLIDNDKNRVVAGLEINVSCPNIKEGGVAFGTNPKLVEKIVKSVKSGISKDIIVITKLTPNVTDITSPAKAAINGGTDAISMINTLRGMAIDVESKEPFLGNIYGGLSGPAIKPIGIFMVYECFKKIPECHRKHIPIIGIGGISCWRDAIEYILAGATAVGIGTAWFVNNDVFIDVLDGMKDYCVKQDIADISDLIGAISLRK